MKDFPVPVKRSIELMGLLLAAIFIYLGQSIFMPLIMAFFFSLMLMPVYRFFRRLHVPEAIAIFLPILLLLILLILVVWVFSTQVSNLLDDLPTISQNVTNHFNNLTIWVSNAFDVSPTDQLKFINEQSPKLLNSAGSMLRGAAGSLSSALLFFGLLPIYMYLIMMYRNLFLQFFMMWFKPESYGNVSAGIKQTETIVKSYLIGLLIQITYITVLLGGTLLLFGIKNAFLIGIMFAFLNLIPYLGALIGNILGVLITLASSENIKDIIIVLAAITVVQLLDNNILMPRVVGSQVKINPLISIVGIFIGNALAGISGMFLAMPILAVLKIAFDRSTDYKKWGVLLGEDKPAKSPLTSSPPFYTPV